MATGDDTTTTSASDTFDGLDVTLDVTLPTWTDATLPVDIDITTNGVGPSINVAIVVDTSGSTGGGSGSDVDGIPGNETFLQAEQFAAKELFQSLIDAGYDPENVNVTLIEYNSGASLVPPSGGVFNLNDQTAFENAVDSLTAGGGTNYENALEEVLDVWNDTNTDSDPDNNVESGDTNLVVFLSDGANNSGNDGGVEAAEDLSDIYNVQISAIGVGASSNLNDLNLIDNTGTAVKVEDAADLAGVITAPPPLPELVEVEVFIDGVSYGTFTPGDGVLVETALGYTIACEEIEGFTATPGTTISVEVVARFDDGSDVLTVGAVIIPVTVCFAEGTQISTPDGYLNIENLSVGDKVLTRDNGAQTIRWIGHTAINAEAMTQDEALRPVRIAADAFGRGKPVRDLVVSRQHRIFVDDWRAELLFESRGVLVPAHSLVNENSIQLDYSIKEVTFYHIVFDDHEIVDADGLLTESFHPCQATVLGMKPEAREELFKLFPALENGTSEAAAYEPSYPCLKNFEGKMLAAELVSE